MLVKAAEDEARAFFLKMIGDYCRYIAESAKDQRLEDTKTQALESYKDAMIISERSLSPCSPIRLGLVLNFSVFYYELIADIKQAIKLGEKALQDAVDKLDDCDEETFRDA